MTTRTNCKSAKFLLTPVGTYGQKLYYLFLLNILIKIILLFLIFCGSTGSFPSYNQYPPAQLIIINIMQSQSKRNIHLNKSIPSLFQQYILFTHTSLSQLKTQSQKGYYDAQTFQRGTQG